jgi:hypothetical protein
MASKRTSQRAFFGVSALLFAASTALEEIEDRHGEIPRDRDVVLYCS